MGPPILTMSWLATTVFVKAKGEPAQGRAKSGKELRTLLLTQLSIRSLLDSKRDMWIGVNRTYREIWVANWLGGYEGAFAVR